jgi:hypothetical protein
VIIFDDPAPVWHFFFGDEAASVRVCFFIMMGLYGLGYIVGHLLDWDASRYWRKLAEQQKVKNLAAKKD